MPCLQADAIFLKGHRHLVCEDYAVAATNTATRAAVAVVCDGCSGGTMTDLGARFFALNFQRLASRQHMVGFTDEQIILQIERLFRSLSNRAARFLRTYQLPESSCDATVIGLFQVDNRLFGTAYGDGAISVQTNDGAQCLYEFLSKDNQPEYLMNLARQSRTRSSELSSITQTKCELTVNGVLQRTFAVQLPFTVCLATLEDLQCAAVFSDGVSQVNEFEVTSQRFSKRLSCQQVVSEILDFQTDGKQILRRQCVVGLQKAIRHPKRQLSDDLSAAVLYSQQNLPV